MLFSRGYFQNVYQKLIGEVFLLNSRISKFNNKLGGYLKNCDLAGNLKKVFECTEKCA
jgi:hypothetical protein